MTNYHKLIALIANSDGLDAPGMADRFSDMVTLLTQLQKVQDGTHGLGCFFPLGTQNANGRDQHQAVPSHTVNVFSYPTTAVANGVDEQAIQDAAEAHAKITVADVLACCMAALDLICTMADTDNDDKTSTFGDRLNLN